MRFLANGPDIPSDLLYARDEGEVLFFCGAGVSRAEAGGPSFWELAERVVKRLGSARSSPAQQILRMSAGIQLPPGIGGMPPADRLFALLEQEFAVEDVRAAVSKAVEPIANPGLGPHRSLLDLSTMPDGRCRLVTTNFDRVFQLARPEVAEILPPTLPDPRRTSWEGIVHLHGMVRPDYSGAASEEFVLSSADFGRAYLADGWATTFMRALMERYLIVFVGYSADDPPIQYLLEALSRSAKPGRLYAFHSGEAEEAAALWRHKGVEAIPFQGFPALWSSLDAWGRRARDPDAWRRSVVTRALDGPRKLAPHERGQVAHLVSSEAGAREFSRADSPPPADWLCVFDPAVRYDRARISELQADENRNLLDPRESFGLDFDPSPIAARNSGGQIIPTGAWSAFEELPSDVRADPGRPQVSLRGLLGAKPSYLPPRLEALGGWIGRVAKEGVAAWWAGGQNGLHPWLEDSVRRNIGEGMKPALRSAWRLILSAPPSPNHYDLSVYGLLETVRKEGWSLWALREFEEIKRPRITVDRAFTAPPLEGEILLSRLVQPDVVYPAHPAEVVVPDEFLARYVRTLRGYLETAHALELEVAQFFYPMFRPIVPYDDPSSSFSSRDGDLPSLVIHYAHELERLSALDPKAAQREVRSWPGPEDAVFRILRVWSAGQAALTSAGEASRVFADLPDDVFWDREVQRDLLVSLKVRWSELAQEAKRAVEAKILTGSEPWEGADPEQYAKYRAHRVLSRLEWMRREGLEPGFDADAVRAQLLKEVPGWTVEDAEDEVYRSSSRGGWVATDTEPAALSDVPIGELLDTSDALSGRSSDFLVERRPFKGVAEKWPVRALAALVRSARSGETRKREWSDFLGHDARAKDPLRLKMLIAKRLASLPKEVFRTNLQSISFWLKGAGPAVSAISRLSYLRLWERIVQTALERPEEARSSIVSDSRRDWVTAAINSPVGRMTALLCDEFAWEGPDYEKMTDAWRARADRLLLLDGDLRCHLMAILGTRLKWLYYVDPDWTDRQVISPIEHDPKDPASQATLSSLIRYGGQWSAPLFSRLKGQLIALAAQDEADEEEGALVSLLRGWNSNDPEGRRMVSDEELREALIAAGDRGRCSVLRHLDRWSQQAQDWSKAVEFIEKVWPRQLIAKTPAAASALAGLALSAGEQMPAVTRAVLPLLTAADNGWADSILIRRSDDNMVERFPEEHLALLHAALGTDVRTWAYGTHGLIDGLGRIASVNRDPRLVELRRRMRGY